MATFDEIGRRLRIDQSSLGHGYLTHYERELSPLEPRRIVIISGQQPHRTGLAFAEFFAPAQVIVFSLAAPEPEPGLPIPDGLRLIHAPTVAEMHRLLAALPSPDVIIEDGNNHKSQKLAAFQQLFLHLRDGGSYVVEDLHSVHLDRFADRDGESINDLIARLLILKSDPGLDRRRDAHADDLERARSIDRLVHYGKIAMITKQGRHLIKVAEPEATTIMNGRLGPDWGREVTVHPKRQVEATATCWINDRDVPNRFHAKMRIPDLYLREYANAICAPRQLVVVGDVITPSSFHHTLARRLSNRATTDAGTHFARVSTEIRNAPRLPGTYYHLASEFPGGFGHVLTEDLSRLWAWDEVRAAHPEVKLLVGSDSGPVLPNFQAELLAGYGIAARDVVCIDHPVRVDRLFAATQQFHNAHYIDPDLADGWRRIRSRLYRPGLDTPRRLFVGRGSEERRKCHNGTELERFFTDRGFTIFQPETVSMAEQLTWFANAEVIAGYGGSGQFSSIFTDRPVTRIVLAAETYNATNEWLISSIKGDRYFHFWCPADVQHPKNGWSVRAFHSDFRFDFECDGAELERIVGEIG